MEPLSPGPSLIELALAFGLRVPSSTLLESVKALEVLLTRVGLRLTDLVDGRPVADFSSGAGELGFFLESLGCGVVIAGCPPDGIRQLGETLGSQATIAEADWDAARLPASPLASYGLAALVGTLNQTRNPLQLMDQLAVTADYCFVSARVARHAPDGTPLGHLPVAWLLNDGEGAEGEGAKATGTGAAETCWIYSETGLRRLIERSGWRECAWINSGDQAGSQPIGAAHAEHVYCLLRRRDLFTNGQLLDGWYPAEGTRSGWRWTRDMATVRFATPRPGTVRLVFVVPPERFLATGAFSVNALSAGEPLAAFPVEAAGEYTFDLPLSAPAPQTELAFWVAPAATAAGDERVLGVIARQILFTPV